MGINDENLAGIEQTSARSEQLLTGVPSGFADFDRLTKGLQPGHLIILASRPNMGKTALALNLAQNAAIHHQVPVGIFSPEIPKEQLGQRMLSAISKVASQRMLTGQLEGNDWPKLAGAAEILSGAPIYIDDSRNSLSELLAKGRRLKADHNVGMLVIDSLQLMQGRQPAEMEEHQVSEIFHSLKTMAKELNIPVVVLSRLNSKLASRDDKRPQLSDLDKAAVHEENADMICFIHRDESYNRSEETPKQGTAELIIGKHKNGPNGTIKLAFLSEFATFENLPCVDRPSQPMA